jgi:hypothetical protein
MFNNFDRIKINCGLNGIKIISDEFRKVMSPDMKTIIAEEFKTVGLKINVNHQHNKLFLDFSAKLLGVGYTEKINCFTLRDIYKIISEYIEITPMQFYRLSPNYTEALQDVEIVNIPDTIVALFSLAILQDNFNTSPKVNKHQNQATSFSLKKNVLSRASNEYVSIYSKYNELFASNKTENRAYLQTLNEDQLERVKSYFMGKLRVEYKCNSKARIRASFGLEKEYNLYHLLTSERNVVESVINDIYVTKLLPTTKYSGITHLDLDRLNTLVICNNDLGKIYELYKSLGGTGQRSKVLKRYKELMKIKAREEENEKIKLLDELKEKLKW